MAKNKFLDLSGVSYFLNKCKVLFAPISHGHNLDEITDYVVDTELSSTSSNPVENKAVQSAIQVLEDKKADKDELPSKTSELTNDSGFITLTEVNTHNVANDAHNDIRLLVSDVSTAQKAAIDAVQTNVNTVDNKVDDHITDTVVHMTSDQKSQLSAAYEHANTEDVHVTAVLKAKLNGIEEGATKTIIDSELSSTSENPVQNKVIKNALDSLELITVEDIDAICATDIEIATLSSSEVKF